MTLKNPDHCPKCRKKTRSAVIDSKLRKGGYRRRLLLCHDCGATWPTYTTVVDPRSIIRSLPEWARHVYLE